MLEHGAPLGPGPVPGLAIRGGPGATHTVLAADTNRGADGGCAASCGFGTTNEGDTSLPGFHGRIPETKVEAGFGDFTPSGCTKETGPIDASASRGLQAARALGDGLTGVSGNQGSVLSLPGRQLVASHSPQAQLGEAASEAPPHGFRGVCWDQVSCGHTLERAASTRL